MRAAFYAPLKSPEHPLPSGDRTMARLLMKALSRAGFEPELASGLRTLDLAGDPGVQAALRDASHAEAERLLALYAREPERRPDLWFTYHCYYKAPDWLGPRIADALSIPYVIAEASRAGKRAHGPWALGHTGAEAAIARADRLLVMTPADREALGRDGPERLVDLPPFVDLGEWGLGVLSRQLEEHSEPPAPLPPCGGGVGAVDGGGWRRDSDARRSRSAPVQDAAHAPLRGASPRPNPPPQGGRGISGAPAPLRLLTVAMMRPGDKLASYRLLADALHRLSPLPFTLDVAGDGEARGEVEAMLAPFTDSIRFHGAVEDRPALSALYASADIFLWPAVNEAYGMAFLEAQAHGLPVVAGEYGGVAAVVRHGRSGLLCPPADPEALAQGIRAVAVDLPRYAEAAARFVRGERGIDHAATILKDTVRGLLPEGVR